MKNYYLVTLIKSIILWIVTLLFSASLFASDTVKENKSRETLNSLSSYQSKVIIPIPAAEQARILKYHVWQTGCPVSLNQLALIRLTYWGFDQRSHRGALIVNQIVAKEVVDIFKEIYEQRFPIALMMLPDNSIFQGSDDALMAANNTSAFNCRPITGSTSGYSNHSYGLAIDINTMINPYIKGSFISPPSGYTNRTQPVPGIITHGDPVYTAFISRGWSWGGDWTTRQDYQHFEKPPANLK